MLTLNRLATPAMFHLLPEFIKNARNVTLLVDGTAIPLKTSLSAEDNPTEPNVFRLEDNLWRISFQGAITCRKAALRWNYTHELLKRQNEDVGAIELSRQFDYATQVQGRNGDLHVTGLDAACDLGEEIMPPDALRRVMNH